MVIIYGRRATWIEDYNIHIYTYLPYIIIGVRVRYIGRFLVDV